MLNALDITLTTDYHPDSLAHDWSTLEEQACPAFFLSWHWIGTWLGTLPSSHKPLLLRVKDGPETIALALLGRNKFNTLLGSPGFSLALNESGDSNFDVLAVEYNGLLAQPKDLSRIWPQVLSFLEDLLLEDGLKGRPGSKLGKIHLSGIPRVFLDPSNSGSMIVTLDRSDICRLVDLGKVRGAGERGLHSLLSRSARTLLKRSQAEIPGGFHPSITRAENIEQALEFFLSLRELHQKRWRSRGMSGAFSSPYFNTFHQELIGREFAAGVIDLIKVTTGEHLLGYLYNFRYREVIYNYQSGFNYENSQWRPGLLSHQAAINWYTALGADTYDFLAGDSQYKRIFANEHIELFWGRIFRRSVQSSIEHAFRVAKRATLARLRA